MAINVIIWKTRNVTSFFKFEDKTSHISYVMMRKNVIVAKIKLVKKGETLP